MAARKHKPDTRSMRERADELAEREGTGRFSRFRKEEEQVADANFDALRDADVQSMREARAWEETRDR